jgi:hypothetical protein
MERSFGAEGADLFTDYLCLWRRNNRDRKSLIMQREGFFFGSRWLAMCSVYKPRARILGLVLNCWAGRFHDRPQYHWKKINIKRKKARRMETKETKRKAGIRLPSLIQLRNLHPSSSAHKRQVTNTPPARPMGSLT